jgi:hypothetical protein
VKLLKGIYNTKHVEINRIETDDETVVLTSGSVIVMITAEWSGQARMHIAAILNKLDSLSLGDVKLYFLDIDQTDPEIIKNILGKQSHGNGETVWLESGEIRARFAGNDGFNKFIACLEKHFPERH